jgi:hypothetical protein
VSGIRTKTHEVLIPFGSTNPKPVADELGDETIMRWDWVQLMPAAPSFYQTHAALNSGLTGSLLICRPHGMAGNFVRAFRRASTYSPFLFLGSLVSAPALAG